MFYEDVFRALNKSGVQYAVAGGVAVVLHGYPRFTADLDLVIQLEEENIEKFFDTVEKLGYLPKVPITKEQFKDEKKRNEWRQNKRMVVLSFFHRTKHLNVIDVFVYEPIKFGLIAKEMEKITIMDITIPVLSLKHLIHLKENAGRQKDLVDIANLKEIEKMRRKK